MIAVSIHSVTKITSRIRKGGRADHYWRTFVVQDAKGIESEITLHAQTRGALAVIDEEVEESEVV